MSAQPHVKTFNEHLYRLLEKAEPGDRTSWWVDITLSAIIVINLTAVCLETVPYFYAEYNLIFWWIETISVSLFSLEYISRIKAATVIAEKDKIPVPLPPLDMGMRCQ